MVIDPVLEAVASYFIRRAEEGWFNGLSGAALLQFAADEKDLRRRLAAMIKDGEVSTVFARTEINMHIKRHPDLSVGRQLELLEAEALSQMCVYPTADAIEKRADMSQWNDRPFSRALALAEPQLTFRAFDMGVMERYISDPRYQVHFADYMGRMSISDAYFASGEFPDRDKVALQTFGLGFDSQATPRTVVYLRYLSQLSPEHQQYWNSYIANDDVMMCNPYYQSSILGEVWQNRSVRNALVEEISLIDRMSKAIWGDSLFRRLPTDDVPIALTSFLRPTADNFHRFVMALDKLLSESINIKFFEGKIALESETLRPDGKIAVRPKGTLTLLEEWLLSEIVWDDPQAFRIVVIKPLRDVRRLRQTPAHSFTADRFSIEYYDTRKRLLSSVFNSLSNIRVTFARYPKAGDIKAPTWLDDEQIDVF